jgi:hypothetical protein
MNTNKHEFFSHRTHRGRRDFRHRFTRLRLWLRRGGHRLFDAVGLGRDGDRKYISICIHTNVVL